MDRLPNNDEDLLDTDSDDSDYDLAAASASSHASDEDDSESNSDNDLNHVDDERDGHDVQDKIGSDDEDDDDSDYEEGDAVARNHESKDSSSSGSSGSGDVDNEDEEFENESSVDIGQAPFTGYIFPGVHKLVSNGNVEGLSVYLAEMFNPAQGGPQVWEVSDSLGRNAIHLAILHNNLEILSILLDYDLKLVHSKAGEDGPEYKYSAIRRKFDDMGVVHLAMTNAPWDTQTSISLLEMLYCHPAISLVPMLDYWKRTPLHVAAMTGKPLLVDFLNERNPDWLFQPDAFNMFPLHYGIDCKNTSMVETLLNLSLSRAEEFERAIAALPVDRHPITHAVAKCSWECLVQVCRSLGATLPDRAVAIAEQLGIELAGLTDISHNPEAASKCVQDRSKDSVIVFDLDCLGHVRLPSESEDGHLRLKRIKFVVENPNRLEVLVGKYGSLRTSEFQSVRVIDAVPMCPLTDVVRVHDWAYIRKIIQTVESLQRHPTAMARLDKGDTNVTADSWAAALKAAGAVVQAMDLVCSETCKNAFVAVRPPGHHVSSKGAVDPNMEDDDTGSNGFCLLNNVAIGAAYALCVHRHVISRVAIIDFDIHHGNGTEAIVRGLAGPKTTTIPLNFTGLTGQLEMHSYHPWLDIKTDKDSVFFSSVHRFDGQFYPQSGQTGVDGNIVNAGLESFSTSADFRTAFSQLVLPGLLNFAPDLIIISAGFDGHVRDRLASGEWDITEEDYYWVTEQLVAVANMSCKGRIVSVLEGGYNTRGGWLSPLAQCVASHVRALSSSWACKFNPADHLLEEEEDEEVENEQEFEMEDDTSALLAKADAVIDEVEAPAKRIRVEEPEEEFTELFGSI